MVHEHADDDQRDATYSWIDCPGCGYGGRIGVPLDYPADVSGRSQRIAARDRVK